MLNDFFQRSLNRMPRIPRAYMDRMTVLLRECHFLSSSVSLESHSAVSSCMELYIDVLTRLIDMSLPSDKAKEEELKLAILLPLEEKVRETLSRLAPPARSVEKYNSDFARAKETDEVAAKRLKGLRATLKDKLSRMDEAPKRHFEFTVYPPYIPPLEVSQGTRNNNDRPPALALSAVVCADDWSLAALMVIFMRELLEKHRAGAGARNSWIGQRWTFYKTIPLYKKNFSFKDEKGRITSKAISAPSPMSKVVELANALVHEQQPNDGTSKYSLLHVTVLPDRKTTVFFNFRVPLALGNVFKFSNLVVLKDKAGNLLTLDILENMFKEPLASPELKILRVPVEEDLGYDQSTLSSQSTGTSWDYTSTLRNPVSGFGSYTNLGDPVPTMKTVISLFDEVMKVQDALDDEYHWTCSHGGYETPPVFTGLPIMPVPTPSFPVPHPIPPSPPAPTPSFPVPHPAPPSPPAPTPSFPVPHPAPPSPPSPTPHFPAPARPITAPSDPPPRVLPPPSARLPAPRPPGPPPTKPIVVPPQPSASSSTSTLRPSSQELRDLQGRKMRGNAAAGLGSEGPEFSTGERKKADYKHQAGAPPAPVKKLGFLGRVKKAFGGK
ncbi:hypothetical protein D9611_000844 [Ephemerocybe angulata]|uniref:Uncharacterized protein n=1 Tax=Ephemerocybe angulata TaxID=980116 RepID=A0A8H5BM01_9AGAR|nr:hypothetical protein D9611_000844 [Tulosesus angulatus]